MSQLKRFDYICGKNVTMKISKDDMLKQKEMLTDYIGKQVPYNGQIYRLIDFLDININDKSHSIQCVMCLNDITKCETVKITEIFRICYPYVELY